MDFAKRKHISCGGFSLKIAMITTWKARCGIADYSEHLAKALAKQNVDVYVIRIPRFGPKEPTIFQNVIERIPVDKVDLIHCQHEYGLFGALNKRFFPALETLKKPIVTTMHAVGNWDEDTAIMNSSQKIIVHNEFCRKRLPKTDKSIIIPHGMTPLQTPLPPPDACKARLKIHPKTPIVGYLGFVSKYKGLETLIDAVVKLPDAGLLIGGGWFVEEDTEYISSLKQRTLDVLPHRCQWLGYVAEEDLAVAYGAMDVLVYPSLFMTESGALLMALSHEKAVIASDLPPVREKDGALTTFKDPNDLVEKIDLLLKDKGKRADLELGARKYALENSWEEVAKLHKALYQSI